MSPWNTISPYPPEPRSIVGSFASTVFVIEIEYSGVEFNMVVFIPLLLPEMFMLPFTFLSITISL